MIYNSAYKDRGIQCCVLVLISVLAPPYLQVYYFSGPPWAFAVSTLDTHIPYLYRIVRTNGPTSRIYSRYFQRCHLLFYLPCVLHSWPGSYQSQLVSPSLAIFQPCPTAVSSLTLSTGLCSSSGPRLSFMTATKRYVHLAISNRAL